MLMTANDPDRSSVSTDVDERSRSALDAVNFGHPSMIMIPDGLRGMANR
jgi:hypothetical protein